MEERNEEKNQQTRMGHRWKSVSVSLGQFRRILNRTFLITPRYYMPPIDIDVKPIVVPPPPVIPPPVIYGP